MKAVSLLLKRWLFLSFLCLKLALTPAEQQNTYLDRNLTSDSTSIDYQYILTSNGVSCMITKPTRVTPNSSSLIDHILTNDINNTIHPGIIQTDLLSDHYPVFCVLSKNVRFLNHKQATVKPTFRDYTNFAPESFKVDLNDKLIEFIKNELSTANTLVLDTMYDKFINIIKQTIDEHAQIKIASRKRQKLLERLWITRRLLASIKRKQKMYKTHFLSKDENLISLYRIYANKLNKIKYLAKKTYFNRMFDKHKSNPRKTWQMIKSLLPNAKDSSSTINKIVVNKTEINDATSTANHFDIYFSSVGKKLAMKFSEQNDTGHHKFLGKRVSNSIYLEPTSPQKVFKEINLLNLNKSLWLDGISAYSIKLASDIIAVPLSILCNLSCFEGVFPNCIKNAEVIPLFKTGSKSKLSNYRPISLLSCLSKVLEKLFYSRLINYLNKNSILHHNQYGCCSGLSTSHALLDVVTTTSNNINKMLYTLLIFIDYKKAFDTVCHKILLSKLEHYGMRGPALNLISSYLNHRTQYVSINDSLSALSHTSYEVPQGSILGPLLFLLYINDINNIDTYSILTIA